MDVALHNFRRRPIPARAAIGMQITENGMKDRSGPGYTRNFAHRRAVKIPHPHADRKLGSKSDGPIIAKVGAGAGFAGDWVIESERGIHAESQGAGGTITHDIRDLPNQLRPRIAAGGERACRENAPGTIFAQPCKTGVGIRDLEQTPFAISEGKTKTINLGRLIDSR